MDAFWVEATQEEAINEVFPKLQPAEIVESKEFVERFIQIAKELCNPPRPYCFLVAQDLSTTDPFHVHYPFHQLWNGYSPFEVMATVDIQSLEEVGTLVLPIEESK